MVSKEGWPETTEQEIDQLENLAHKAVQEIRDRQAEIVAEHREVDDGEFIEEVSKVAHGLNEISSSIREENLE